MKALVLNAVGRGFDLDDVDIASPMGREVLVEVRASGLCHTDLLFATHEFVPTPGVLGHEIAGVVAAVGADVTQFRVGDHVVGSLAQSCGGCARCLSGRPYQADHVFDFVGLKAVAEQGLAMLGVGGGLYLVGVATPDVAVGVNIVDAIGGQKRVEGVNFGSTNFKRDIPMYAALYLQGRMNLDDLVSKQIALREVNEGYAALKGGSLNRVVATSF